MDQKTKKEMDQKIISEPAANLQPPYPLFLIEEVDEYIDCCFHRIIRYFFQDVKYLGFEFYYIPSLKVLIWPDGEYHDYKNSEWGKLELLIAREYGFSFYHTIILILQFFRDDGFKRIDDLFYYLCRISQDRKVALDKKFPVAQGIKRFRNDDGIRFLKVKCPYCSEENRPVYHVHGDRPYTLRGSHCTRLQDDDFVVGGDYLLGDVL